MSMEQLKHQLVELSPAKRDDVAAFLWHMQHANEPEHQKLIAERLADKDPSNWLTLGEFERRLGPEE